MSPLPEAKNKIDKKITHSFLSNNSVNKVFGQELAPPSFKEAVRRKKETLQIRTQRAAVKPKPAKTNESTCGKAGMETEVTKMCSSPIKLTKKHKFKKLPLTPQRTGGTKISSPPKKKRCQDHVSFAKSLVEETRSTVVDISDSSEVRPNKKIGVVVKSLPPCYLGFSRVVTNLPRVYLVTNV